MPSSSASDSSSTAGPSTPSGRSTPDVGAQPSLQQQHKGGAPAGLGSYGAFGNFPSRRSSTPAQSFLPPRFWQQAQFGGGGNSGIGNSGVDGAPNPTASSGNAMTTSMPPRRTSFGTALGGGSRLNVLSAFGMSPSTPIHRPSAAPQSPKLQPHLEQQQQQQKAASVAMPAVSGSAIDSAPSSPVVKPQRQRSICFLPGPDGLCVENRARRKSEA